MENVQGDVGVAGGYMGLMNNFWNYSIELKDRL